MEHKAREWPLQLAYIRGNDTALQDARERMALPRTLAAADEDAAGGRDVVEKTIILHIGLRVGLATKKGVLPEKRLVILSVGVLQLAGISSDPGRKNRGERGFFVGILVGRPLQVLQVAFKILILAVLLTRPRERALVAVFRVAAIETV